MQDSSYSSFFNKEVETTSHRPKKTSRSKKYEERTNKSTSTLTVWHMYLLHQNHMFACMKNAKTAKEMPESF